MSNKPPTARGWVFYDGDCRLCRRLIRWTRAPLERRGYHCVPLQEEWVGPRLGLEGEALLEELRCLTPQGAQLGGADAVRHLLGVVGWLRPLAALLGVWPFRAALRAGYRWVARRRSCAIDDSVREP